MLLLPIGLMVSSPAVAAGLLLDSIAATVVGAYGMRKLRAGYSGAAARVRRSSDGTEQDIGFVGTALDVGALLAFCGAGSGFVSKWYDQSGAGQHVAQTTASHQPQIVASGSVASLGNATARPTALFASASQQSLALDGFALGGTAYTMACVASKQTQSNIYPRLLSFTAPGTNDYGTNASVIFAYHNSGTIRGYQNGLKSSIALGTSPFQLASVWDGANNTMVLDGVAAPPSQAAGALAATGLLGVGTGAGEPWEGAIAEVIILSGALSAADQAVIRASQQAYYGTP